MATTRVVDIEARYKADAAHRGMKGTERRILDLARIVGQMASVWAVWEIAKKAQELAQMNAQLRITTQVFNRLAAKAGVDVVRQMDVLRRATLGTISDLELMQRVGAAVDAGLTFDQATIALQFLRRYSLAFGKDFNQLVQTIFTGLQRGSVLFLDDAGIILSAQDAMFKGMGDLEKKTALVNRAIGLMAEKMETLPAPTQNAVVQSAQLAAQFDKLLRGVGALTSGPVDAVMELLAGITKGLANAAEGAKRSIEMALEARKKMDEADQARGKPMLSGFVSEYEAERLRAVANDEEKWLKTTQELALARRHHTQESEQYTTVIEKGRLTLRDVTKELVQQILKTKELTGLVGSLGSTSLTAFDAMDTGSRRFHEILRETVNMRSFANPEGRDSTLGFYRALSAELQVARNEAQKATEMLQKLHTPTTGGFTLDVPSLVDVDLDALEEQLRLAGEKWLEHQARLEVDLAKAVGDRQKIREAEDLSFKISLTNKARETGRTEEEITELVRAAMEHRKRMLDQPDVRRILLLFDADVSQVKDQSDLAAYSMGLLTERLAGLSAESRMAIDAVQSVSIGIKLLGDTKTRNQGIAGIMGGVVSAIGMGISIYQTMQAEADALRVKMRDLEEAIRDTADASGTYARSLQEESLDEQRRLFRAKWEEIIQKDLIGPLGNAFDVDFAQHVNLDQFTVDLQGFRDTLWELSSSNRLVASVRMEFELLAEQLEAIERAASGGVFSFSQAMDEYSHVVRLEGLQDAARRFELLRESMGGIGILIDEAGTIASDLSGIPTREQWRLQELIADLQRDIAEAEIKAREETAAKLIDAIHDQAAEVQRALDDAWEAQRQATLRYVRLQFDIQESALRQSFAGRLTGARTDPLEMARVMSELQREIEYLRIAEAAAGEAELGKLREQFEAARKANEQATLDQIAAVERATQDLGTTFETALARELTQLSTDFGTQLEVLASVVGDELGTVNTDNVVGALGLLREDMLTALATVAGMLHGGGFGTSTTQVVQMSKIAADLTPVVSAIDRQTIELQVELKRIGDLTEVMLKHRILTEGFTGAFKFANLVALGQIVGQAGAARLPSFDVDVPTRVPGPVGRPMQAIIHGGETISPAGAGPQVVVNVTVQGGSAQSKTEIKRMYQETLEPLIEDSWHDGRLSRLRR